MGVSAESGVVRRTHRRMFAVAVAGNLPTVLVLGVLALADLGSAGSPDPGGTLRFGSGPAILLVVVLLALAAYGFRRMALPLICVDAILGGLAVWILCLNLATLFHWDDAYAGDDVMRVAASLVPVMGIVAALAAAVHDWQRGRRVSEPARP